MMILLYIGASAAVLGLRVLTRQPRPKRVLRPRGRRFYPRAGVLPPRARCHVE